MRGRNLITHSLNSQICSAAQVFSAMSGSSLKIVAPHTMLINIAQLGVTGAIIFTIVKLLYWPYTLHMISQNYHYWALVSLFVTWLLVFISGLSWLTVLYLSNQFISYRNYMNLLCDCKNEGKISENTMSSQLYVNHRWWPCVDI